MIQHFRWFQKKVVDESAYSFHFPKKLYSYLKSIGLIDKVKETYISKDGQSTTLSIREEKVDGSFLTNAVSLTIVDDALDTEHKNKIYYFTKGEAFKSAYFDEDWDYPCLSSDTATFIGEIMNTIGHNNSSRCVIL